MTNKDSWKWEDIYSRWCNELDKLTGCAINKKGLIPVKILKTDIYPSFSYGYGVDWWPKTEILEREAKLREKRD